MARVKPLEPKTPRPKCGMDVQPPESPKPKEPKRPRIPCDYPGCNRPRILGGVFDASNYSLASPGLVEVERGRNKPVLLARNETSGSSNSGTSTGVHKEAATKVAVEAATTAVTSGMAGAAKGGIEGAKLGAAIGAFTGAVNGVVKNCGCHKK